MPTPKRIIVSRIDSIGDVILTLPMAGWIKKYLPGVEIFFLGSSYTKDIVECSQYIDLFLNWDSVKDKTIEEQTAFLKNSGADCIIHVFPRNSIATVAAKAKIATRIGTNRKVYHWWSCNKLVNLTRRRSVLHEAQLNLKLCKALRIPNTCKREELHNYYGFSDIKPLTENAKQFLDTTKKNIIIHPKSQGSAREWGMKNFNHLIDLLDKNKFNIIVGGGKNESEIILNELLTFHSEVQNTVGKLSLSEYISLITHCDYLVAASTGPLHIAAAAGIKAIGLFPPMRPIFPTRWAPLGKNATHLVLDKKCNACRKSNQCACIESISPEQVFQKIN